MARTIQIVPRQEHDGVLSFEAGLDAVWEGYRDRANFKNNLIDEPRHRLIDPTTGMGIYNHFGISPGTDVGGALIHAHQVTSDDSRQEFGNEGEAVYVIYDSDSSLLRAIVIGELGGAEYPPMGMVAFGTALEVAVGTDALARDDSTELGIFGSGRQAQNNLVAIAEIRELDTVRVYSPTTEHREKFEQRMSNIVDAEIKAVDSPASVIEGVDIILCATSASSPVFDGSLLEPGQHVSTIVGADAELVEAGQAPELRREIDNETIRRAHIYAANSVAQGKQNRQGDLHIPVKEDVIDWDDIVDLPDIVGGDHPGRENDDQITLYKQNSIQGVTQMALTSRLLDKIKEEELGMELEINNPRENPIF